MSGGTASSQAARFERDGVAVYEGVLDADEVACLREEVRRLTSAIAPELRSVQFSQPHLFFRWAHGLSRHPGILALVEPLIGPDILAHSSTIFYKAPRDAGFVSWHQDGHYWGIEPPQLVSAWVALTDSTTANGCLRAVLGSHKLGPMAHGESAVSPNNLLRSGLQITMPVEPARIRDLKLRAG